MDKVVVFQEAIYKLLDEYGQYQPSYGDIKVVKVIDPIGHHYQLMIMGWFKYIRSYGAIFHADIIDGRIWIQHDGTEDGIANRLVDMGIAKEDIVLAYQEPFKRAYSGFAVVS
ncbi:MAG: XisI protein [Deinococcales bacterium]